MIFGGPPHGIRSGTSPLRLIGGSTIANVEVSRFEDRCRRQCWPCSPCSCRLFWRLWHTEVRGEEKEEIRSPIEKQTEMTQTKRMEGVGER